MPSFAVLSFAVMTITEQSPLAKVAEDKRTRKANRRNDVRTQEAERITPEANN